MPANSRWDLIQHFKRLKYCLNFLKIYFDDRTSRYNRVKKPQHDAQLILSIFRQPLHVSGVSRPVIRRDNRMCTLFGTYILDNCLLSCMNWNPFRTTESHLKKS